ncbi:unnamed protein product [Miscanthus lutarioriparius]|uniref:Uncharacterized protein n=1 Tax=Miscanthus lutarioriparius TaxID=422564 RepID=A0A811MJM0_9POAL|nr:unnamed protein product [Miscanthus lutarioriparius]
MAKMAPADFAPSTGRSPAAGQCPDSKGAAGLLPKRSQCRRQRGFSWVVAAVESLNSYWDYHCNYQVSLALLQPFYSKPSANLDGQNNGEILILWLIWIVLINGVTNVRAGACGKGRACYIIVYDLSISQIL